LRWSGSLNSPNIPSLIAMQARHPPGVSVDSGVLFKGGREVVIQHDGQTYRLRITRQNKLILTK